jgi:hypothetical protein
MLKSHADESLLASVGTFNGANTYEPQHRAAAVGEARQLLRFA